MIGRIEQHGYALGTRYQLAKQLHAFCHQVSGEEVDTSGIAARSIEARHQTELDRVTAHAEHDWDRRSRSLGRLCGGGRARRDNHAQRTANEIGRKLRQSIVSAFRPAVFERHVLTVDVTGLSESLPERGHIVGPFGGGGGVEKPDHRHRRLLRTRRKRPRYGCTGGSHDELAPLHSITWSARASRVGGISRPRAFAVVMFMMRSNLVGCSTGMSAGFAPRRILST